MGKEWDSFDSRMQEGRKDRIGNERAHISKGLTEYRAGLPFQEFNCKWATEALRVLKPGGFMFAMGGTRTHHRLTCGIEDAGFLIRDELSWVYMQGFPKAQSLDALIDKKSVIVDDERNGLAEYLTIKRKEKGLSKTEIDDALGTNTSYSWWEGRKGGIQIPTEELYKKLKEVLGLDNRYDKLVSDEEKRRKFEEKREVIGEKPYDSPVNGQMPDGRDKSERKQLFDTISKSPLAKEWQGWKTPALKPAFEPIVVAQKPCEGSITENVMKYGVGGYNIDECRIEYENKDDANSAKWGSDAQDGNTEFEGGWKPIAENRLASEKGRYPSNLLMQEECFGKLSKYFLIPKAASNEKNDGLDGFEERPSELNSGGIGRECSVEKRLEKYGQNTPTAKNIHPCCKPVLLMQHLIKLTTKPNYTILDPFLGSGTTAVAALQLNRNIIGIEMNEEYMKIAKARIAEEVKQTRLEL